MGKNTLHLNWGKPIVGAPPSHNGSDAASTSLAKVDTVTRKHAKPRQADPAGAWWGVLAVDKWGRAFAQGSKPIFRHPTAETANSEAEYLSATHPDRRFVVLHCCASYQGGNKQ